MKLLEIFQHDVNLFKAQKLMDYSLLVAVTLEATTPSYAANAIMLDRSNNSSATNEALTEEVNRLKQKYAGRRNVYVSPQGYVYYMGIIDYLQEFDTMKILENRFKRLRHGQKKMEEVSAIEPEPYAARFLRFVKRRILSVIS